jgi:putative lipoprotein
MRWLSGVPSVTSLLSRLVLAPRAALAVACVCSGLLAAACASVAPTPDTPRSELTGTRWVVQQVNGARAAGANALRIVFGSSDRLSGTGGCNSLSGFYETDAGNIDVRALARTERACAADVMRQEEALVATLAAAARYQRDGERLVISADGGREIVLTPAT